MFWKMCHSYFKLAILCQSKIIEINLKYGEEKSRLFFSPQRVQHNNLQATINNLENAAAALSNLIWLLENSGYSFNRVDRAIDKLVTYAAEDISKLYKHVRGFDRTYVNHLSPIVDSALYFLDRIQQKFQYSTHLTDIESDELYAFVEEEVSLLDITINVILPKRYTVCELTCGQTKPTWWQGNDNERQKCQRILYSVKNDTLSMIADQNATDTKIYVNNIVQEMDDLITCIGEYKLSVEKALSALENIIYEMDRLKYAQTHFDYGEFLTSTIDQELIYTNKNISWLGELQLNYSRNETTKVSLSKAITPSTESTLSYTMDAIIKKLESNVFSTLHMRTELVEIHVKRLIHESLGVMADLAPYFVGTYIEDIARRLDFWKRPTVELNSPNIVRFQYSTTETWRTWPRSIDLQELTSDDSFATHILAPYAKALYKELYIIHGKFITVKYEVLSALNELVTDLQSFNILSAVDKKFVM